MSNISDILSSPAEFLRTILEKISRSYNIDLDALISFLYILDRSYKADVDFEIGNVKVCFQKWLEHLKMTVVKTEEDVKFSTEINVMKYLPEIIDRYSAKKKKEQNSSGMKK